MLCRPIALSPQPKLRRPSIEVVSPHRSKVTQTVYCEVYEFAMFERSFKHEQFVLLRDFLQ